MGEDRDWRARSLTGDWTLSASFMSRPHQATWWGMTDWIKVDATQLCCIRGLTTFLNPAQLNRSLVKYYFWRYDTAIRERKGTSDSFFVPTINISMTFLPLLTPIATSLYAAQDPKKTHASSKQHEDAMVSRTKVPSTPRILDISISISISRARLG